MIIDVWLGLVSETITERERGKKLLRAPSSSSMTLERKGAEPSWVTASRSSPSSEKM